MPTQILVTQYKCNTCGQRYLDLSDAADCEDRHFKIDDFKILNFSKEIAKQCYKGDFLASCFPRSFHVENKKTGKIASYIFGHDQAKHAKVKKVGWPKNIDEYYDKKYGFPNEEEDF